MRRPGRVEKGGLPSTGGGAGTVRALKFRGVGGRESHRTLPLRRAEVPKDAEAAAGGTGRGGGRGDRGVGQRRRKNKTRTRETRRFYN